MKVYIVIPAHNEADFLPAMLHSLCTQTLPPEKVVVVDDASRDDTFAAAQSFTNRFKALKVVKNTADEKHQPGGKVVKAFLKGLQQLDEDYDVLMKLDADLILPENYLETLVRVFKEQPQTGMAAGVALIEKKGKWTVENLTDTDHIRGALKAYRKTCYQDIGGLVPAMGWDTVDEMLARYNGWQVFVDTRLKVQHLRPTGEAYSTRSAILQGEAFYQMRYRPVLAFLASLKLSLKKKNSLILFICYTIGFWKAFGLQRKFLIDAKAGKFIRGYRYKKIVEKLTGVFLKTKDANKNSFNER